MKKESQMLCQHCINLSSLTLSFWILSASKMSVLSCELQIVPLLFWPGHNNVAHRVAMPSSSCYARYTFQPLDIEEQTQQKISTAWILIHSFCLGQVTHFSCVSGITSAFMLEECPSFKAVVYSYENRCIDPMPATHTRSSAKRNLRFTSTTIHCSITLCNV